MPSPKVQRPTHFRGADDKVLVDPFSLTCASKQIQTCDLPLQNAGLHSGRDAFSFQHDQLHSPYQQQNVQALPQRYEGLSS